MEINTDDTNDTNYGRKRLFELFGIVDVIHFLSDLKEGNIKNCDNFFDELNEQMEKEIFFAIKSCLLKTPTKKKFLNNHGKKISIKQFCDYNTIMDFVNQITLDMIDENIDQYSYIDKVNKNGEDNQIHELNWYFNSLKNKLVNHMKKEKDMEMKPSYNQGMLERFSITFFGGCIDATIGFIEYLQRTRTQITYFSQKEFAEDFLKRSVHDGKFVMKENKDIGYFDLYNSIDDYEERENSSNMIVLCVLNEKRFKKKKSRNKSSKEEEEQGLNMEEKNSNSKFNHEINAFVKKSVKSHNEQDYAFVNDIIFIYWVMNFLMDESNRKKIILPKQLPYSVNYALMKGMEINDMKENRIEQISYMNWIKSIFVNCDEKRFSREISSTFIYLTDHKATNITSVISNIVYPKLYEMYNAFLNSDKSKPNYTVFNDVNKLQQKEKDIEGDLCETKEYFFDELNKNGFSKGVQLMRENFEDTSNFEFCKKIGNNNDSFMEIENNKNKLLSLIEKYIYINTASKFTRGTLSYHHVLFMVLDNQDKVINLDIMPFTNLTFMTSLYCLCEEFSILLLVTINKELKHDIDIPSVENKEKLTQTLIQDIMVFMCAEGKQESINNESYKDIQCDCSIDFVFSIYKNKINSDKVKDFLTIWKNEISKFIFNNYMEICKFIIECTYKSINEMPITIKEYTMFKSIDYSHDKLNQYIDHSKFSNLVKYFVDVCDLIERYETMVTDKQKSVKKEFTVEGTEAKIEDFTNFNREKGVYKKKIYDLGKSQKESVEFVSINYFRVMSGDQTENKQNDQLNETIREEFENNGQWNEAQSFVSLCKRFPNQEIVFARFMNTKQINIDDILKERLQNIENESNEKNEENGEFDEFNINEEKIEEIANNKLDEMDNVCKNMICTDNQMDVCLITQIMCMINVMYFDGRLKNGVDYLIVEELPPNFPLDELTINTPPISSRSVDLERKFVESKGMSEQNCPYKKRFTNFISVKVTGLLHKKGSVPIIIMPIHILNYIQKVIIPTMTTPTYKEHKFFSKNWFCIRAPTYPMQIQNFLSRDASIISHSFTWLYEQLFKQGPYTVNTGNCCLSRKNTMDEPEMMLSYFMFKSDFKSTKYDMFINSESNPTKVKFKNSERLYMQGSRIPQIEINKKLLCNTNTPQGMILQFLKRYIMISIMANASNMYESKIEKTVESVEQSKYNASNILWRNLTEPFQNQSIDENGNPILNYQQRPVNISSQLVSKTTPSVLKKKKSQKNLSQKYSEDNRILVNDIDGNQTSEESNSFARTLETKVYNNIVFSIRNLKPNIKLDVGLTNTKLWDRVLNIIKIDHPNMVKINDKRINLIVRLCRQLFIHGWIIDIPLDSQNFSNDNFNLWACSNIQLLKKIVGQDTFIKLKTTIEKEMILCNNHKKINEEQDKEFKRPFTPINSIKNTTKTKLACKSSKKTTTQNTKRGSDLNQLEKSTRENSIFYVERNKSDVNMIKMQNELESKHKIGKNNFSMKTKQVTSIKHHHQYGYLLNLIQSIIFIKEPLCIKFDAINTLKGLFMNGLRFDKIVIDVLYEDKTEMELVIDRNEIGKNWKTTIEDMIINSPEFQLKLKNCKHDYYHKKEEKKRCINEKIELNENKKRSRIKTLNKKNGSSNNNKKSRVTRNNGTQNIEDNMDDENLEFYQEEGMGPIESIEHTNFTEIPKLQSSNEFSDYEYKELRECCICCYREFKQSFNNIKTTSNDVVPLVDDFRVSYPIDIIVTQEELNNEEELNIYDSIFKHMDTMIPKELISLCVRPIIREPLLKIREGVFKFRIEGFNVSPKIYIFCLLSSSSITNIVDPINLNKIACGIFTMDPLIHLFKDRDVTKSDSMNHLLSKESHLSEVYIKQENKRQPIFIKEGIDKSDKGNHITDDRIETNEFTRCDVSEKTHETDFHFCSKKNIDSNQMDDITCLNSNNKISTFKQSDFFDKACTEDVSQTILDFVKQEKQKKKSKDNLTHKISEKMSEINQSESLSIPVYFTSNGNGNNNRSNMITVDCTPLESLWNCNIETKNKNKNEDQMQKDELSTTASKIGKNLFDNKKRFENIIEYLSIRENKKTIGDLSFNKIKHCMDLFNFTEHIRTNMQKSEIMDTITQINPLNSYSNKINQKECIESNDIHVDNIRSDLFVYEAPSFICDSLCDGSTYLKEQFSDKCLFDDLNDEIKSEQNDDKYLKYKREYDFPHSLFIFKNETNKEFIFPVRHQDIFPIVNRKLSICSPILEFFSDSSITVNYSKYFFYWKDDIQRSCMNVLSDKFSEKLCGKTTKSIRHGKLFENIKKEWLHKLVLYINEHEIKETSPKNDFIDLISESSNNNIKSQSIYSIPSSVNNSSNNSINNSAQFDFSGHIISRQQSTHFVLKPFNFNRSLLTMLSQPILFHIKLREFHLK